uniref:ZCF37 n=1 Tax=Kalanchoe fedtschenkoi TaxID=63787 RepID=A0A7N0UV90_KALFE
MLRPLICGSGSFHESGDELDLRSPDTKIKKSRRCSARSRRSNKDGRGAEDGKKSKNPYATRGLDKFSSLVADLEEKRQKIYAQTGDDSYDMCVWFNFSGSDDCKPVILKLKDKKHMTTASDKLEDRESLAKVGSDEIVVEPSAAAWTDSTESDDRARKKSTSLMSSYHAYDVDRLRHRPFLRLLTAVILILILLSVFGRSVTVVWMTVGWYLLPTTNVTRSGVRRVVAKDSKLSWVKKTPMSTKQVATADQLSELCSLTKKKYHVRKPSENRLTMSPETQHHHHRKSW